jgi:lysyl-tRNA synthetase class 1
MHWVDFETKQLQEFYKSHIIATGITPSGEIHVGNMREILTGDALYRGLRDSNEDATLIYIGDTIDPLRKVYPFLDDSYEEHVGKPLSRIPCPCKEHESYAEHYLSSFLNAIEALGIKPKVLFTHEMYEQGMYSEAIKIVLDNTKQVKEILEDVSGRDLPKDWYPYNPFCKKCGRLTETTVLGFEHPHVKYKCGCGYDGEADIRKADGKLPWRVDWPARWLFLKVTCEPFGKDHAAAGGSYASGKRIMEDVFKGKAPHPVVYEWIQLKGKGAMSSSKGIVVSGVDMLRMTPPEVFRYYVLKNNPGKHIDFDTGLGILNIVDEYDMSERSYFEKGEGEDMSKRKERIESDLARTYELAQPFSIPEDLPLHVPYRHLVNIIQINSNWENIVSILKRTEHIKTLTETDEKRLKERIECVRFWLEKFAPDMVKFSLAEEIPKIELDDAQKDFLRKSVDLLEKVEWDSESIHNVIHESSRSIEMSPKKAFALYYTIFINKNRGPKLGYFLSYLNRDFVVERIKKAINN